MLEELLTGLHDSRGDHLEKEITNQSYCCRVYKQITWWVYQRLVKGNRRVIPLCALWVIRNTNPELDGSYVLYNEVNKDKNFVDILDIFTSFIGNEKWVNKKTILSLKPSCLIVYYILFVWFLNRCNVFW